MVNPSNSLTAPASNTRYQVKLHSTATETEPSKMSDSMKLAALGNNLKPFDNTMDTIEDFLDDFDRHTRALDLKEPQEKLDCLVGHLAGPVKTWFRYQPKPTQANYADLRKALQDTFVITDQAKHMARSSLFNMMQAPYQSVADFLHNIQEKARGLDLSERDLVSIALNGLNPTIQRYVAMDRPTKIADILKSPAAQPNFGTNHQASNENMVLTLQEELRAVREQLQLMTIQQAKTVAVATAAPDNRQVRFDTACSNCNHRGNEHHREPRHHTPNGRNWDRHRSSSRDRNRQRNDRDRSRDSSRNRDNYRDNDKRNSHDNKSKCQSCGSTECNGRQTCWARNKTCHHCNRKGHIKPACWLYNSDRRKDMRSGK